MILRIAVREVESWLLADAERLADFLGVRRSRIPPCPDTTPDPKALIVDLAKSSRKREIREELVPAAGSTSKVGKNYVGQLLRFTISFWQIDARAQQRSPSLKKALLAVQRFSSQITGSN